MIIKKKFLRAFVLLLSLSIAISSVFFISAPITAYAAANNTHYFNKLNQGQQAIYTLMLNKLQNTPNDDGSPIVVNLTTSEITSLKLTCDTISGAVSTVIQPAYSAFLFDHPEIFWIDFIKPVNIDWTCSGKDISSLTLTFPSLQNAASDKKKIDAILANYAVTGATDYDKLKNMHDYLINLITSPSIPNPIPPNPRYHNIAGALIDYVAVCEGYSKAFKLLCDKAGIPCVLASGNIYSNSLQHMWNCVQIDGNWYAVDLTWDDKDNKVYYDYFLVGSSSVDTNFNRQAFSQSHTPDKRFANPLVLANFSPPVLSDIAYINRDINNTNTTNNTINKAESNNYNVPIIFAPPIPVIEMIEDPFVYVTN